METHFKNNLEIGADEAIFIKSWLFNVIILQKLSQTEAKSHNPKRESKQSQAETHEVAKKKETCV